MKGEQMISKIEETAKWIKNKTNDFKPEILVIAGSGLSGIVPELSNKQIINYCDIPNFSKTSVLGHKGQLIFGELNGYRLVIMLGRFHYYEGHDITFISFPIRLMKWLGVKSLIVTAAVGSLKKNIKPGDIVLIKDHINLMGTNPLIGNYAPIFGEMFIDMAEPYNRKILESSVSICKKLKIKANKGIYLSVSGPAYETESEVKMYAKLGGDIAGMSVVPEVISARQLNMDVCGITWVSNFTTGISKEYFDHSKVLELGKEAGIKIRTIIENLTKEKVFKKGE
jgi:purine-nucleoside phosphorylase